MLSAPLPPPPRMQLSLSVKIDETALYTENKFLTLETVKHIPSR